MAKNQLHPGAKWLFRLRGLGAIIWLLVLFGWILIAGASLDSLIGAIISIIVILIVLLFIIEIYARMAYNRWFYEFTDSNLKLERGIIWKRYSNVPYERVQNVDIQRGILARLFGFSTVMIQTAGFSVPANGYGMMAEGYLPAVSMEEAEQIREFLMKKISKRSKQGL